MPSRAWGVILALALIPIVASLHRAQPLGWDEVEFFRATKWVGEGQVPFRDFWEHHTPLQWLVFAPVARLFATGPGADAVVAMRWAQFVVWIGIFALVLKLARERERWWALATLLATPLFVRSAIEYRVDILGNLGFIAALVAATRQRWIAFGALMSLGVLANMRIAPLVIFTAALFLFRRDEQWDWNPHALRMGIGVVAVALPFIGWLLLTNAWQPFLDGVIEYNVASSKLIEVDTLRDVLLAPFHERDLGAIVLWVAALAGCLLSIRTPLAIVFLASIATIAAMEVQYEYHFQGTYLLMVPLAAVAFARVARWQWIGMAVAVVAIALGFRTSTEPMRYQDYVMREVDRRTRPGETVFDGTGYALTRKPAYRYWFLPAGLRFLAANLQVKPYEIAKAPPAAVIYNLRLQRWFEIFPRTAAYAVRNHVPLTRDLWLPGLTTIVPAGGAVTWTVPRDGLYALHASEPLVRHPWLTQPLTYAALQGPRATQYAIELRRLPRANVAWSAGAATAPLAKGTRVTITSGEPRPIGVLVVPADVTTLCTAPGEEFQF